MRRRYFLPDSTVPLILGVAVLGCGDHGTEPDPPTPAASALAITPQAPSLRLGEEAALEVAFLDAAGRPVAASGTVTWSSSAPAVVGVDDAGAITAHAVGAATIQARAGSLTGTTDVRVLAPAPVTGANAAVSATIDSAGGVITATGVDGTRYTLRVPRRALREATQIALTPLASIEHFPAASGASAAVLFEPDGLRFTVPAELTIVAPAPFAAGSVAFSQSGDSFLYAPARVSGDSAHVLIGHFSSGGTATPTAEEVAALGVAGSAENSAGQGVAQELNRSGAAGEHPDVDIIAQHLQSWLDDGVMPGLEAAASGSRPVEDALGEWLRWLEAVQTWADGHLANGMQTARAAAVAAMRASIDRLNQQCTDQNDASLVDDIMHLAALAAFLGFDNDDPTLGLDAIFADLCMRIVIEATLADPFVEGSTLEVRAGLAVGTQTPDYATSLDIALTSTTASLSQTSGMTDGSGVFVSDVSLDAGHNEVVIDIRATHPSIGQMTATHQVTARAQYELELQVDGTDTTVLETGDVAWLGVSLNKAQAPLPGARVSLAILGGGALDPAAITTDDGGLGASVYTAPDEADTVRVVATFSEGSEQLADTVTIEVTEVKKGKVAISWMYQSYGAAAYAQQSPHAEDENSNGEYIEASGSLAGAHAPSAASGSAVSTGNVTHESSVAMNDTLQLLVVDSEGTTDGTVIADFNDNAGATFFSNTGVYIEFEVLDEPVYYEIIAHGTRAGTAAAVVSLEDTDSGGYVFNKPWSLSEELLITGGWLQPGQYALDIGAIVEIGAGRNSTDFETTATGTASYGATFRILDAEPEATEPMP